MNIKKQNLATIAALEARGDLERLDPAINTGLDNGLTVNQIKEALSQLYAYTGFPRSLNALGVLQRVVGEREQMGKTTIMGADASPLPEDYDALKQGTSVQTRLTGGTPFNYEFAPQTDYYLKAHLFGDIFARNTLTEAEREIVTVSAISALEGCEPQLIAHVRGARNCTLSPLSWHRLWANSSHGAPARLLLPSMARRWRTLVVPTMAPGLVATSMPTMPSTSLATATWLRWMPRAQDLST